MNPANSITSSKLEQDVPSTNIRSAQNANAWVENRQTYTAPAIVSTVVHHVCTL